MVFDSRYLQEPSRRDHVPGADYSPGEPAWGSEARAACYRWLGSLVKGARVLEWGCGLGEGLAALKGAGAAEVVGAVSSALVAEMIAARDLPDGVRVVEMSGNELPFADASFELVIIAELPMCGGSGAESRGREARRVLVPGGAVVVLDARPVPAEGEVADPVDLLAGIFSAVTQARVSHLEGYSFTPVRDPLSLGANLETTSTREIGNPGDVAKLGLGFPTTAPVPGDGWLRVTVASDASMQLGPIVIWEDSASARRAGQSEVELALELDQARGELRMKEARLRDLQRQLAESEQGRAMAMEAREVVEDEVIERFVASTTWKMFRPVRRLSVRLRLRVLRDTRPLAVRAAERIKRFWESL